jgi:hypothetical protein
VRKPTGFYPKFVVEGGGRGVVSQAGGVLLTRAAEVTGLEKALSQALGPWRAEGPGAIHDPGKIVLDLAVALAVGGDCLSDIALLRTQPGVFGPVASDPTVSRLVTALAGGGPRALASIRAARAVARSRAWELAADDAPGACGQVVVDLDATLVTAHSDKEHAAPTWKSGYGFHPLWAFIDHGPEGTGEAAAVLLRAGNAGSNTAADHITVTRQALAQLPPKRRRGRATLIRADSAGGTKEFLNWLNQPGRALSYSVGFTLTEAMQQVIPLIPADAWTPAIDADGHPRPGAWVAEITGMLELTGWPPGIRIILRKERPHPGAQLRITDIDGLRITAFATGTPPGGPGTQLAALELRHRRRARCEDRIKTAKDTGLTNLPLHSFAANQIWCELIALALDLLAWTQTLALTGNQARRWEPKTLRTRIFSTAARITRSGRRTRLKLPDHWPWTGLILTAWQRLTALPGP